MKTIYKKYLLNAFILLISFFLIIACKEIAEEISKTDKDSCDGDNCEETIDDSELDEVDQTSVSINLSEYRDNSWIAIVESKLTNPTTEAGEAKI